MKKKIILIVAIVLVVAISAVALVSCASSPSKFTENFIKAKSFTMETSEGALGSMEIIYDNGNASIIMKDKDGNITMGSVLIVKNEKASLYTNSLVTANKWVMVEVAVDSNEAKGVLEQIKSMQDGEKIKDDDFIKDGSYWYNKNKDGTANKISAYKFTSDKMESYSVSEKDGKTEYTLTSTIKLSGKVTAPKI